MDKDSSSKPPKKKHLRRINVGLDATIKELVVAEGALAGKSQEKIAKYATEKLGLKMSHDTVREILSRENVQKIIEEQHSRLIAVLPKATDNIINAVNSFDKKQDLEDKKISWEATKRVSESAGTLSANQSVVHQTFIQQQNNVVIPPVIAKLMEKHFGGIIDMGDKNWESSAEPQTD